MRGIKVGIVELQFLCELVHMLQEVLNVLLRAELVTIDVEL